MIKQALRTTIFSGRLCSKLQYQCQLFSKLSIEHAEIMKNCPWKMMILYWKTAEHCCNSRYIANSAVCGVCFLPCRATGPQPESPANCNIDAIFFRIFHWKMQRWWRIAPEKRRFSVKQMADYFAIRGKHKQFTHKRDNQAASEPSLHHFDDNLWLENGVFLPRLCCTIIICGSDLCVLYIARSDRGRFALFL